MDGMRMDPSLNPLSSNFQHYAVKNVSQQMGALKTNKELNESPDDESKMHQDDMVELSGRAKEATAQQHLENASHAGLISEQGTATKKKGESKTSKAGVFVGQDGDLPKESDGQAGELGADDAVRQAAPAIDTSKVMERSIDEIREGVPPPIYEAAKKIVEGQMNVRSEPAKSLTEMKAVPDITPIDVSLVEFHPIMDIHDTNNHPMPVLEDGTVPA